MRATRGLALGAAALAASCSLVVQFHDQSGEPAACDASACAHDAAAAAEASGHPDAGHVLDAGHDTGPARLDAGVDQYAPCLGLASGTYCGNDGLRGYAGASSDLVRCADGGIGAVTACSGGCVHIQNPFPDACNPCVGVADGQYCGRDLAGFPQANADFLIQCKTGAVAVQVACAHGCGSHGTASACY